MVNELLEGIHLVAAVEAISLGSQAGVHPWILYNIISNAAGNSWYALCYKDFPFVMSDKKVFQNQIGETFDSRTVINHSVDDMSCSSRYTHLEEGKIIS